MALPWHPRSSIGHERANIQVLHLKGRLMNVDFDAPQIKDMRDLKFTVDGEPFSQCDLAKPE